ncbi:MAG: hypothetical protein ABOK23_06015 [Candidatus Methanoperedens sp.]|nr:hypothetical protein [Candidatus Methanoperedens sp.]
MKIALKESIPVFIILFYFISTVSAQTSETIPGGKNSTENITSNIQENIIRIVGNNSINGRNLSNQNYSIQVVLDHIFISKKNNSLEISEIVVFRNEGPEIYYSKDNHTFFAISTPSDVKNLKTLAMECCLVQDDGVVYMDPMQPIKHGDNFEMQVSYTLLPKGSEYVYNKSAMYNTTSLLIFIDKKSGVGFDGLYETLKLNGNEYNVISFKDLNAGEIISIPIKLAQEQDYLYAGIGLLSLFSMGMVYRFKEKIFRKRGKEYTLEELELEKRRIFHAIHGFEKHAGAEKSEEYVRLMEEYKQKAIQIFIKIDKINNKGQPELLKRMDETQTKVN